MRPFRRRQDRPINCMQVGRRLQRYLDGELDDLSTRRVIRHLEDCRRCGMEATAYSEVKASLALKGAEIPADAVTRLRAFGERLLSEGPPDDHGLPDETTGA